MPSPAKISPLPLHDPLPIYLRPPRHDHRSAQPVHRGFDIVRAGAEHAGPMRSEEHTSELQSLRHLVCRLPPRSPPFPYTTLFRSIYGRRAMIIAALSLFIAGSILCALAPNMPVR